MATDLSNIFGTRLKMARRLSGLSLQELADKLENKVTKQALSKYEMGQMNPTSEVLLAIASTLGLKQDYFLKAGNIPIEKIEFRKRAGLSKKNEEAIIEKARDYVERYLEIESILGISNEFVNPLQDRIVATEDDVEKAAEALRRLWHLGVSSLSNIVETLELKGIKIILIEDVDEIDGFSGHTSNNIPVVVVNTKNRPIERVRFTIIHELAHILLIFTDAIDANKKLLEEYCHYFSSCFLMPRALLVRLIGGTKRAYINISELINIKEFVGMSIRAIVHRCKKIGIITETYYLKWMVYMSKTYGSREEPGQYKGQEKAMVLEQLVGRALAEGLISTSKAAVLCNISMKELRKKFFSVDQ